MENRPRSEADRNAEPLAARWSRYDLNEKYSNCLKVFVPALKFLGPDSDVPWQRVVSASGQISSRGPGTEGAERQRQELESEGVTVTNMQVSWREYGWFPESVNLVSE